MKYRHYKTAAFLLLVFGALFCFLQVVYKYHFFYIEQNQLFLFTGYYLNETVCPPGGLAGYIGEFLVQFFIRPYAGALITALLFTGVTALCTLICRRLSPVPFYLLYALPALSLLFMHFNFNYSLQGSVAYLMMLAFLLLYISINRYRVRLITGLLSVVLLFWWGGAIVMLFALCAVLWELMRRTPKGYIAFLLLIFSSLLGWASVYWNIQGAYRFAFLPDQYYHHGLVPDIELYFSWISLPVILIIAWFFRQIQTLSVKKEVLLTVLQLAFIIVLFQIGIPRYGDLKSLHLKKLDYLARTEQWDAIIQNSGGPMTNYLYLNYLNLALAEKGMLGDRFFHYDQRDIKGLFIPWNKSLQPAVLLSDIYYAIGNSALSQEMAFESYVSTSGYGNPRLLKRLVQTNLIYGAYPVAEKYLDILEKTLFYRDWAKAHRKYLYNDKEIESHPSLGVKRECLVKDNFLANTSSTGSDLVRIAERNPSHRSAIEYFGCALLLMKDLKMFEELLNNYYGTDVLPSLPVAFQEAVITLYESQPDKWAKYNIPQEMIDRFNTYKKQVLSLRNNSGAANLLRRSFGDTFWFFYMYK